MKKWKTLASKKLFSHLRHAVYEDTVALPDGHTTEYLRSRLLPEYASAIKWYTNKTDYLANVREGE